jgi:hypothetical protein
VRIQLLSSFALVLAAGCAVRRPIAQPLAEARYFHAEDALAKASDRIAERILAKLPPEGPFVVALSPVFLERQIRLTRALLYAGLTAGRDVRLLPFAAAQANTKWPVVEIVLLGGGSELAADTPPLGEQPCAVLHVAALVRVHRNKQLLWSEVMHEEERELPLKGAKP